MTKIHDAAFKFVYKVNIDSYSNFIQMDVTTLPSSGNLLLPLYSYADNIQINNTLFLLLFTVHVSN